MEDSAFALVLTALEGRQLSEQEQTLFNLAELVRDNIDRFAPRTQLHLDNLVAQAAFLLTSPAHPTLAKISDDLWFRVQSPIGLRNPYVCELFKAGSHKAHDIKELVQTMISDEIRATNASADNSAYDALKAQVTKLAETYPDLGLTFGYIGNCDLFGQRWDDRRWYVFTKLATPASKGACDISFGGYPTSQLGHLMIQAERKLEAWCQAKMEALTARTIRQVG